VSGFKIGYTPVSTEAQDLTAQRNALAALGVAPEEIPVDHGLTGTNLARPGLREALAACRSGDILVATKLDRLARSSSISAGLSTIQTEPVGQVLFKVMAMATEFESDLIKMRTREGLAVARATGKLRGRKPKLTPSQEAHSVDLQHAGEKSPAELAEHLGVVLSTVYRAIERAGGRGTPRPGPLGSLRT